MSMMIQAFLAFDGSVHKDLNGLLKADASSAVREWSRRHGIGRGGEWSADMVSNALIENGHELTEAFRALDLLNKDGVDLKTRTAAAEELRQSILRFQLKKPTEVAEIKQPASAA